MKYSTPEKHGIKSADIAAYIKTLEDANLSMHDIIIARHGEIVFETYWKPFHKDNFRHLQHKYLLHYYQRQIPVQIRRKLLSDIRISKLLFSF